MLIRQLLDYDTHTYTYIVADTNSREACIIDPVLEKTEENLQLLEELNLSLVLALDTHVHADHITGLGQLREHTGCCTMFGEQSGVACASASFQEGSRLSVGDLEIECMHTPGHTAESYCFYLRNEQQHYLFSGDTLLIRGTGRTDFQNGSAKNLYHSLRRLIDLPDETVVYPGHDYNGRTTSSILEERNFNPRILIADIAEFEQHMANLNLPDPKMMDVAVSANLACGEISKAPKEH